MLSHVIKRQVPATGRVRWVIMEAFAKDHATLSAKEMRATKSPELARVDVIWNTMERTVINLAATVMHRAAMIEPEIV